jgi:hypothetical protein
MHYSKCVLFYFRFGIACILQGFDPRQRQRIFPLACVQTSFEAHPAFCPMGTRDLIRGKAQLGRDADHSILSSAVVKNEELYILTPLTPAWQ